MYQIKGKINSNNAPEFEKELLAALPTEIDASGLEYISSAGLRVLLKLSKEVDNVTLNNVSIEVYEILDVTGFTSILTVNKAFREVSVEGCELIGKGMTGDVYRTDKETVIKVFHPNISFDLLIKQENQKARNAFISGVPTAIPYDIVRVGDCYGTVYELLSAKDLVEVITDDREHMDDYIRMFAQTVKEMHSIEVSPELFQSQKTASINALPYLSAVLSDEETEKIRAIYENIPDRNTFIHGDCHLGNVMLQDGEMMFIDLATCGMGHPIFDLTGMYSLFKERANDPKAIGESPILRHFTPEEISHIWDLYIGTYLDTDDEALIRKAEEQISVLSSARKLFAVIAVPGMLKPEMIGAIKQAVIACYDKGLEPICF